MRAHAARTLPSVSVYLMGGDGGVREEGDGGGDELRRGNQTKFST